MYKYIVSGVLLTSTFTAHAAGFALIEQSASGMGNAFAGAAAIAEDASTIYFNPAGMTYIEGTQIVGGLHLVSPNADFNNQGSIAATARPLGNEGGDAGDLALIPNIYYKRDLTETLKFGLGINSLFGLKTEYDKNWIGRFQAVKSELKTININPALAFKVNDQLSLGAGLSAMRVEANLTSAVNFGPYGEGYSSVKGSDWGFGFNLGAIYQATADTRLGVAFRSKVEQHLNGNTTFTRPAGLPAPFVAATPDGGISADLTLPENLSVSLFSHINDKWDLLGDVTWTNWSRFQELRIVRDNGSTLTSTTENWHNTMRYSIGVNYLYSDTLKLRAGLAYDEEAISDSYRTPRIPGNDRKWLALGLGWQATPATKLDVGYAHLFISDASINKTEPSKGSVIGDYQGSVDILSIQVSHHF
jgi:long-chain fatty acid transport protein